MVNVLQAVILTEGEKMVKTPTWHAFNMYKVHQDAELVESSVETVSIGLEEDTKVPNLTESVSVDKDGKLHVTLTNLSLDESYDMEAIFAETQVKSVKGTVLTGKMADKNTFEEPDAVHTESFDSFRIAGNQVSFTIPACSVMLLEVEV